MEAGASQWAKRASLQNTNASYFASGPLQVSSAVVGTNATLLALRASYGHEAAPFLVRSSTSTGLSGWSLAANPHSIHSVAAGNGLVLGSSSRGVLRSSNGNNLSWTYRRPVGPLVFSAAHNMFFSADGNSKEGEYWLDYVLPGNFEVWRPPFSSLGSVFANQTGAVIVNGRSLSTVFIPSPLNYASIAVNVGVDIPVDLAPEN